MDYSNIFGQLTTGIEVMVGLRDVDASSFLSIASSSGSSQSSPHCPGSTGAPIFPKKCVCVKSISGRDGKLLSFDHRDP